MGGINNSVSLGNLCQSKQNGMFNIVDEVDPAEKITASKSKKYVVKFVDTGFVTDATYNQIQHGGVKDYLYKSVAGVGYIGQKMDITTDAYVNMMYKPWNDMIHRCYNQTDRDYPYYGGIGIKVDPRWFNFSTYLSDMPILYGFESKLMYPTMYQLDKDYLQLNIPKSKRVYSFRTCVFLSKHDNVMIMARENKQNSSGYYGVYYKDHSWCCQIEGKIYGRFTIPEAAANLFNYLYLNMNIPFNDINLLNDNAPFIPYSELSKYITKGKQCWLNDYPIWE